MFITEQVIYADRPDDSQSRQRMLDVLHFGPDQPRVLARLHLQTPGGDTDTRQKAVVGEEVIFRGLAWAIAQDVTGQGGRWPDVRTLALTTVLFAVSPPGLDAARLRAEATPAAFRPLP